MSDTLVVMEGDVSAEAPSVVVGPGWITTARRVGLRPPARLPVERPVESTFRAVLKGDTGVEQYSFSPRQDQPQAYFWTQAWQEGEQEADEDIRLGRTRRFSDPEEAIAWLRGDQD